jgi:hypothetical protein
MAAVGQQNLMFSFYSRPPTKAMSNLLAYGKGELLRIFPSNVSCTERICVWPSFPMDKRTVSVRIKLTRDEWDFMTQAAEKIWPGAPITKAQIVLGSSAWPRAALTNWQN